MAGDLQPEEVLSQLKKGRLSPYYLFYGESLFRLEKALNRIRDDFIPEGSKDFNLQVFYGDEIKNNLGELIDTARSFPFMADNRLIILRRTDDISAAGLEGLIPYLEDPLETTCLIFVSQKPDFRKRFYKKIKEKGRAVPFKDLYDNQVVPWIMSTAKEMGLQLDKDACVYLQQVTGNRLEDLQSELEKIFVCYGGSVVRQEDVRKLAIYSRSYTIFELMDHISYKRAGDAVSVLGRFIEAEGKDSALGILGMFLRQVRILSQGRLFLERGGRPADLAKELKLHPFAAKRLEPQLKKWRTEELDHAFDLLYDADGLVKSGSEGRLVLENVIMSICR